MTAEKYQPHEPALRSYKCEAGCPLDRRVMGIESDVSAVKRMVTGMYEKVGELAETANSIHEIVRDAGEPKYNHADDWDLTDEEE